MDIHNSIIIHGIRIYSINSDGYSDILFRRIYDKRINSEEKKEVYLFFLELELDKVDKIHFEYFTECNVSCEINSKKYWTWLPLCFDIFIKHFETNPKN